MGVTIHYNAEANKDWMIVGLAGVFKDTAEANGQGFDSPVLAGRTSSISKPRR